MTASSPVPTLVTGDPGVAVDAIGRARARRRSRVGHTRPGLPTDPGNAWNRAVSTWADALRTMPRDARGPRSRDGSGLLSEHTRELYLRHVGWFAGDHPDVSPWDVRSRDVAAWFGDQRWSTSTYRKVSASLRAFYAWAVVAGLCDVSPLAGVSVTVPSAPGPRSTLPAAWREPLDEFATWQRAAARQASTIRTRRENLANLATLHANPWAVTEGDLGRWLSRPDLSPATKRVRRASARAFYSWAVRAGYLATDPAEDLDPVRQRRALPRPAPTEVVRAALDVADDRVRLAIYLAAYAGLRRAEIASLHTQDVHESALHVVGKGGHERLIPLHPDLARALAVEFDRRRSSTGAAEGWLFPARNPEQHITARWLGTLVRRALGPGWTTHTLRHRFASQTYAAQRDLRAVQELLGHSKPETTARYAAVPDGALAAAVAAVTLG